MTQVLISEVTGKYLVAVRVALINRAAVGIINDAEMPLVRDCYANRDSARDCAVDIIRARSKPLVGKQGEMNQTVLQSIVTKYLPATSRSGARIKASCRAGSLIRRYDDGLRSEVSHQITAMALADRFDWRDDSSRWAQGCIDDDGYVFVRTVD